MGCPLAQHRAAPADDPTWWCTPIRWLTSISVYLGYQREANLPLSGECFPFVNQLFPSFRAVSSYFSRSSGACRLWLGTSARGVLGRQAWRGLGTGRSSPATTFVPAHWNRGQACVATKHRNDHGCCAQPHWSVPFVIFQSSSCPDRVEPGDVTVDASFLGCVGWSGQQHSHERT